MSEKETPEEIRYINKEHTDAARLEALKSPRKPTYDTHNHQDNYYKSPENQERRQFENLRRIATAAQGISDVLPTYLEDGTYELDENGKGPLYRYKKDLEELVGIAGYYSEMYTSAASNNYLRDLLENTQEHIEKFREQANQIMTWDPVNREMTAHIEPFITIANEAELEYVSEYEAKYGDSFKIYSEIMEWIIHERDFNLIVETKRRAEFLKDRKEDEHYQKEKAQISSRYEEVAAFLDSIHDETDVEQVVNILFEHRDDFSEIRLNREYPELKKLNDVYKDNKQKLFEIAKEKLMKSPDKLCGLPYEQLAFVIKQDINQQSESLTRLFASESTVNQMLSFIENDYEFPKFNFSWLYNEKEDEAFSNIKDKRDAIGKLTMGRFNQHLEVSSESNTANYRYIISYIKHLKRMGSSTELVKRVQELVHQVRSGMVFKIDHPAQMVLFSRFVEIIMVDTIEPNDVPKKTASDLVEKLKEHDLRYTKVNKNFASLRTKIKKRFNLEDGETS